jgi:LEA14-like dessication related protein
MSKKLLAYRHFLKIFPFLLLVILVSGCGLRNLATGKIAPPTVTLQAVTVYPPESECWPLTAKLQLHNPNPEPLRILGYDYAVAIAGTDLVQGESVASVTLPAEGDSLVEIPILLKMNAVPKTLKALLLQERLKYTLSGGFRLASVLGGLRVPFHFNGEITRKEGLERLREFLQSNT